MYWYRLEHSPSELLKCSYSEYRYSNPGNENSWYYNILFFSDKLGLDLSIGRNLSKGKFKSLLKKCIQKDFINTWSKIKLSYSQDQGKLNIYFKFKTTFQYENYLDLKKSRKKENPNKISNK